MSDDVRACDSCGRGARSADGFRAAEGDKLAGREFLCLPCHEAWRVTLVEVLRATNRLGPTFAILMLEEAMRWGTDGGTGSRLARLVERVAELENACKVGSERLDEQITQRRNACAAVVIAKERIDELELRAERYRTALIEIRNRISARSVAPMPGSTVDAVGNIVASAIHGKP